MQGEPAVLGLAKGEGEGIQQLGAAQPDETALAHLDIGLEVRFVLTPGLRVQTVRGHQQIGTAGQDFRVLHFTAVMQVDTQLLGPRRENLQQADARDAAKAMTARGDLAATKPGIDVIPVAEGRQDLAMSLGIGTLEIAQRGIREHHPPAEGIGRPVALMDVNLGLGIGQLEQNGEIQTTRSTAQHIDFHAFALLLLLR